MTLLFSFPEQAALADALVESKRFSQGVWEWWYFPDGESYVRIQSNVRGMAASILCSLNRPDEKALPLVFLARTLKELGAAKVTLIAPYLGYMRQDKRFKEGEAVTAPLFAELLSPHIDTLVTVDPHQHRLRLDQIYSTDCNVLSAASLMAQWIKQNVDSPLIIGPDLESEQWVSVVAKEASAPYVIMEKARQDERHVEIILPDTGDHHNTTPVLVDDIISTATTMIKAIGLLRQRNMKPVICMATHALFAGDAYAELQKAGAAQIVTANTITHHSNALDIAPLFS